MRSLKTVLSIGAAAVTLALAGSAGAKTVVATISGGYDIGCGCGSAFDTPALIFNNTSGGTLDNAQIVLTGYQGDNNGQTLTVNLGNLATGSTTFYWGQLPGVSGSTSPNNLAAYDYDDEFIGTK